MSNQPKDGRLIAPDLRKLQESFASHGRGGCGDFHGRDYDQWWLERVAAKTVLDADGCWIWIGLKTVKGYGTTTYRSVTGAIHRQVFKLLTKADLAREDFVCHRCDKPACWNPDHLWLGDPLTNQQDKNAKRRNYFTNQTHCWQGHEFTPENTAYKPAWGTRGPSRVCKTCMSIRAKKRWATDTAFRERQYALRRAKKAGSKAA